MIKVKIITENGSPGISIDGRSFTPLAFRSMRPYDKTISEFYEAGIRLMSILHTGLNTAYSIPYSKFGEIWTGDGKYDFDAVDKQMELFIENAPEAYFNIILMLDTRRWYIAQNPECPNSYHYLTEVAGYEKWRNDVSVYLADVIGYLEEKYGDRIFAYSLAAGYSLEWFTSHQSGIRNTNWDIMAGRFNPIKEKVYKTYTGDLEASIPEMLELTHTTKGIFRSPDEDRDALRYWKFHNEVVADAAIYFSKKTKEIVNFSKLVGMCSGYLLLAGGQFPMYEAHLGFEKVWDSEYVDMFLSPAPYGKPRILGGAGGHHVTVDSIGLRGKMFFHSIDHNTHIVPDLIDGYIPNPRKIDSPAGPEEAVSVIRREFALASVKLTAQWWFDFMGGYFSDEILMSEIKKMITIKEGYRKIKMASASRIAVFADTESLYYVSEESTAGLDCVKNVYEDLKLIGAPHDIFLFSDIDSPSLNIDQYRLIVFLNSFVITEAKRQYINENIKKDGRSILWIYAPGYITEEGFSEKRVSDITGLDIKYLPEYENEIVILPDDPRFYDSKGLDYGFTNKATGVQIFRGVEHPVSPIFYIDDKDAVAIGKYRKSRKTALGFRQFEEFTSYYSAAGNLPIGVLREIARKAGVTIYYEGIEPVYVNNRLIGIHNAPGGTITFNVPSGIKFEELFDGGTYESKNGSLNVKIDKGATKLYLADRSMM